jgi:hypothetical protein
MALSASTPLARTLSGDAFEGSVERGLIRKATLTRNFDEWQTRGQQEILYSIYAPFHKPTVRGPSESSTKGMGKMTCR